MSNKTKLTPYQRLIRVQSELNAPKNLYNSFGKYKYRNLEGILEAVKPLLAKYDLVLKIKDKVTLVGDRYYIEAVAVIRDALTGEIIEESRALAREAQSKKGMDESQVTGTASSYARKYCLNGLFLIDDTKDADTDEHHNQVNRPQQQQQRPQQQQQITNRPQQRKPKQKPQFINTAPTDEQIRQLENYIHTYVAGWTLEAILDVEKATMSDLRSSPELFNRILRNIQV